MARTLIRGGDAFRDGTVQRDDLDVSTAGQALIRKLIAGFGIGLTQTGADAGTGDVTVAVSVPVLLGTITTTTGTSQGLSGLDLTKYKFLRIVFNGISAGASGNFTLNGTTVQAWNNNTNAITGICDVDLATGIFRSTHLWNGSTNSAAGNCGITTSSTAVTLATSAGSFDAGSARVYGY